MAVIQKLEVQHVHACMLVIVSISSHFALYSTFMDSSADDDCWRWVATGSLYVAGMVGIPVCQVLQQRGWFDIR